ncbi:MAG TPA: winged helix-turn-helix transcriptional regulator [Chloroflexi bacterium]|nr:winged helix-turn-helix transcriptional regulator [Chloroflexota bacterium]
MSKIEHDLRILEALERNPETTQANLAAQLGVAVGSVNWYLKRLIRKGYVKATKMERRRLKYFVTSEGLAVKTRLTSQYMEASLQVYRELRQAARETLSRVREAGYTAVRADGKGEAMEIFRLTCLEEGVDIEKTSPASLPEVETDGTRFVINWPVERRGGLADELQTQLILRVAPAQRIRAMLVQQDTLLSVWRERLRRAHPGLSDLALCQMVFERLSQNG